MKVAEPAATEASYDSTVSQELLIRLGPESFGSGGPISGGGDGGMSGLESRVASLEAYTDTIRTDVGAIKPDMRDVRDRMAKLEVKVDHLPSKNYINNVVVAAIVLIGAFITFQGQIQTLFGTTPTLPN